MADKGYRSECPSLVARGELAPFIELLCYSLLNRQVLCGLVWVNAAWFSPTLAPYRRK